MARVSDVVPELAKNEAILEENLDVEVAKFSIVSNIYRFFFKHTWYDWLR